MSAAVYALLGVSLGFIGQYALAYRREHVERQLALDSHLAERRLAHDARLAASRSDVYLHLLTVRTRQHEIVEQTFPIFARLPAPPKPAPVPDDEAIEVIAKVGAFTSAEVIAADGALGKAMNAFGAEVGTHLAIEYQRSGTPDSVGTIGNAYELVEVKRVEVRTRYNALVAAIRHELTTLSAS